MKTESVFNMIDKKIIEHLVEGHAIRFIQQDLNDKMNKFCENIRQADSKADVLKLLTMETETITPSKTKWQVMYIKVCSQRVKDLDWLIKNKHKFPGKSNSQIFKLIKLKERLSEEKAVLLNL
jgi:hypothetical protein